MLAATRQMLHSRLYPSQLKQVLDLATPEGCKAELTYSWPGYVRKWYSRLVSIAGRKTDSILLGISPRPGTLIQYSKYTEDDWPAGYRRSSYITGLGLAETGV